MKQKTTTAASLTVTDNAAGIKGAITSFVGGYNAFNGAVTRLTKFDASAGVAGALQGDFTARSIISQTRATLGAAALGFGGALSRLAEIGITTTKT